MRRLLLILILVFVFSAFSHVSHTKDVPIPRVWTVDDSKAYARDKLYQWQENQYECLDKLWTRESNWRSNAYNKVKVMGKNAGGIPQLLGMSPDTPAPKQIDRGLEYIIHRYGTPCMAWKFHERKGYY
jgi:hypothetical protein